MGGKVFDKEVIVRRFVNHPVPYMLVRMCLFSPAFRWTILLLFVGALALGLGVCNILRISPDGFTPVVRVSPVNWLKSRSLERTALQEIQSGRMTNWAKAYQLAVQNMPADLAIHRRFLGAVETNGMPPELKSFVFNRMGSMLQLGGTNQHDVELSARIFIYQSDYAEALKMLHLSPSPRSDTITILILNSLFLGEFYSAFENELARSGTDVQSSPSLAAVLLARAAMSNPDDPRPHRELESSCLSNDRLQAGVALRLLMNLAVNRSDVDAVTRYAKSLDERGELLISDRLRRWRLMARTGHRTQAREEAEQQNLLADREHDAVDLVHLLTEFGLPDKALDTLDRHISHLQKSTRLWVIKSQMLARNKDWNGLLQLALAIRGNRILAGDLDYLAYFLEGWALLNQQRTESGSRDFEECLKAHRMHPDHIPWMAEVMRELGKTGPAAELLKRDECSQIKPGILWRARFDLAHAVKDEQLLLESAEKVHQATPQNPVAVSNLAAALLVRHISPERALALTFDLKTIAPKSTAITLNHSLALVLNNRASEAITILNGLKPDDMSPDEVSAYLYTSAEAHFAAGNRSAAKTFAARLENTKLFPSQAAMIQNILRL